MPNKTKLVLTEPPNKSFHLLLTGKGGVGKSVVARLLAEFVGETTQEAALTFDADPVNASFAAVPAFGAKQINLLNNEQKIDASRFDAMMTEILYEDRSVVIDSGASSYLALFGYLEENDIIPILKGCGFDVYIHTIITGGAAMDFTTKNFRDVAERFGDEANIVTWLNHFWEQIESDGKPFTEWQAYKSQKHRVHSVLEIPRMLADTSGRDFTNMLKANVSFAEVMSGGVDFNIMVRTRLQKIRNAIFGTMGTTLLGADVETVEQRPA